MQSKLCDRQENLLALLPGFANRFMHDEPEVQVRQEKQHTRCVNTREVTFTCTVSVSWSCAAVL